jgi:hypothetical protein
MTFQFLCPQGHLLQGEEADMGMQCQCPQCGTAFIIPTVERPSYSSSDDLTAMPPGMDDLEPEPREQAVEAEVQAGPAAETALDAGVEPREMDFGQADAAVGGLNAAIAAESFLHIPCPNGHELETPLNMLGQRVMCPHCRAEFTLRREKSIEYQHEQDLLDRRRAQFWFQAAIAAASVVGLALLIMIVLMFLS